MTTLHWNDAHHAIIPLVALPMLRVTLGIRTDHAHPHAHEERFLWQTNVFLNIVVAYLALEAVWPLVWFLFHKCNSRLITVGLHCDYVAVWSFAAACLLPVEFYVAAGDVELSRALLVILYTGMSMLLLLRVFAFVRVVRALA